MLNTIEAHRGHGELCGTRPNNILIELQLWRKLCDNIIVIVADVLSHHNNIIKDGVYLSNAVFVY
jgi:hypothetical protein